MEKPKTGFFENNYALLQKCYEGLHKTFFEHVT